MIFCAFFGATYDASVKVTLDEKRHKDRKGPGNPRAIPWRARRMSLHDAAAAGDLKTVTSALLDPTADVNAPEGKAQDRPLHIAARHGQLEAARILLEVPHGLRRVNVNEINAVSPRPRPRCTRGLASVSALNRVCRW